MRTLASPFRIPALIVALAATAFACGGEGADEDEVPADTLESASATETEGTVSGGIEPSPSSTTSVTITNPMPHAMIVSVEYTGGGETELGIVPAGGEQSFTVAASGGETVTFVATDEANTHSPSETMVLPVGQVATWTIE